MAFDGDEAVEVAAEIDGDEMTAERETLSRRQFLGVGSAALAGVALAGAATRAEAQASPSSVVAQGESDHSAGNAGPENTPLAAENPDSLMPPPTDHGDVPAFWYSFSLAHRRISEGGWARQVNVNDLPLSTALAGVNMRLTAGGIRELHWHKASEWSLMLSGSARLTAFDAEGRSYVKDVVQNDLWFFPPGIPHSIQGLEPDGCEFLLVFDDGTFSEFNTTLVTDWLAHTPRSVIAKNWGVSESALDPLPRQELYIFPGSLPGPLDDARRAAANGRPLSPVAFDFPMHAMPPTKTTSSGEVRIIDSKNFPISTTTAAALVRVHPGGMREMHWHPNSDEWQYYIAGKARMTLFMNGAKARTIDFNPGDVGVVPISMGHYIENTGDTDLVFLETFKSDHYQDLSLSNWLTHTPPEVVRQHLRISQATLDAIPKEKLVVAPA